MNEEVQKLFGRYYELMESQQIREQDLDFSLFQKHKQFLTYMAQVDNSAITIFDLYKKEHVFASYNFTSFIADRKKRIQSEMSRDMGNGVHTDVSIHGLDIMAIYPTEEKLIVRTLSDGQIKVKVVM